MSRLGTVALALWACVTAFAAPVGAEDLFADLRSGKPEIVTVRDGRLKG